MPLAGRGPGGRLVSQTTLFEEWTGVDPSVGPGLARPIGWRLLKPDGTAAWDKTTLPATGWIPVTGVSGAWPGFGIVAPPNVASASALGVSGLAAQSDHTHGQDLSVVYVPSLAAMQKGGVIQQTYAAPNATPAALTMVATQVPFGGAGGVLTQAATLTYDGTLKRLTANNGGTTVAAAGTNLGQIQSISDNTIGGGADHFMAYQGGSIAGVEARMMMNRSRGTFAAPTVVGNLDSIGRFAYSAHDGNGYRTNVDHRVFVDITTGPIVASTYMPLNYEVLLAQVGNTGFAGLVVGAGGDVATAFAPLQVAAVKGFTWHPRTAGNPTGVPVGLNWQTQSGSQTVVDATPTVIDSTNQRFAAYFGGWKSIPFAVDTAAGAQALTTLAGPAGIVGVAAKYETYTGADGSIRYRAYWI